MRSIARRKICNSVSGAQSAGAVRYHCIATHHALMTPVYFSRSSHVATESLPHKQDEAGEHERCISRRTGGGGDDARGLCFGVLTDQNNLLRPNC